MNTNKKLFEEAPVSKAVATMAIPTIITMLVVVIYNMADTYFIGQTNDPLKVAAVSLATPVFMVFMALGNLFGIGGTSVISRALGEKNIDRAKNVSSFCCYASIGFGVMMAIIFLVFMEQILHMIGASEGTIGYAREYLRCVAIGAPFVMFSTAFGNILRGEGSAKESMIGNMIGTVTNIVLDPIMILYMGMGVTGAAVATVIGNAAACFFYVTYFLRKKSILSIHIKYFKIGDSIATHVFGIGVPASLNNILMSGANIILNNVLIIYGDIPVAAMGVAMKANMLAVLLQIGLCVGVQPLIGYNYGARNVKRLKSVVKFTGASTIVLGTVLTVLMMFARSSIINAFIDDASVVDLGIKMMMGLQMACPVLGILFLCINTLQGMGKAMASLILTISRQGVAFIPVLFTLNYFWGLDGIIYAQATADGISILIALSITFTVFHKLDKEMKTI